ncbi:unnamed protein product, partial [Notodromas monacha]
MAGMHGSSTSIGSTSSSKLPPESKISTESLGSTVNIHPQKPFVLNLLGVVTNVRPTFVKHHRLIMAILGAILGFAIGTILNKTSHHTLQRYALISLLDFPARMFFNLIRIWYQPILCFVVVHFTLRLEKDIFALFLTIIMLSIIFHTLCGAMTFGWNYYFWTQSGRARPDELLQNGTIYDSFGEREHLQMIAYIPKDFIGSFMPMSPILSGFQRKVTTLKYPPNFMEKEKAIKDPETIFAPNDLGLLTMFLLVGIVIAWLKPLGKTLRIIIAQATCMFVPLFNWLLAFSPPFLALSAMSTAMKYPVPLEVVMHYKGLTAVLLSRVGHAIEYTSCAAFFLGMRGRPMPVSTTIYTVFYSMATPWFFLDEVELFVTRGAAQGPSYNIDIDYPYKEFFRLDLQDKTYIALKPEINKLVTYSWYTHKNIAVAALGKLEKSLVTALTMRKAEKDKKEMDTRMLSKENSWFSPLSRGLGATAAGEMLPKDEELGHDRLDMQQLQMAGAILQVLLESLFDPVLAADTSLVLNLKPLHQFAVAAGCQQQQWDCIQKSTSNSNPVMPNSGANFGSVSMKSLKGGKCSGIFPLEALLFFRPVPRMAVTSNRSAYVRKATTAIPVSATSNVCTEMVPKTHERKQDLPSSGCVSANEVRQNPYRENEECGDCDSRQCKVEGVRRDFTEYLISKLPRLRLHFLSIESTISFACEVIQRKSGKIFVTCMPHILDPPSFES